MPATLEQTGNIATGSTELPRALAPWREYLDLFPRELAIAIGPLVMRLDALVGRIHHAPRSGTFQPDGFDGLSRRGSYERLLLTEWLLAEEAPEEFLRRAATGEHAFHRIAHRAPADARQCIVLFDAGPNQLGTPRLVHLAALIVFARKAQASGASFSWGILQDKYSLYNVFSPDAVRMWLSNRGTPEANQEHLEHWQTAIEALRDKAQTETPSANVDSQTWIVGGHRLLAFDNLPTHRLFVRDVLNPGERQVTVEILEKGKPARDAVLELPAGKHCGSLLRDPFFSANVELRQHTGGGKIASNLLWAVGGNRLLARTDKGALISWAIPSSPSAMPGKPRTYAPGIKGTVIAAGRIRRTIVMVVLEDETTINVIAIGKNTDTLPSGRFHLEEPVTGPYHNRLLPCFMPSLADEMTICLPAGREPLMSLVKVRSQRGTDSSLQHIAQKGPKVLACCEVGNRIIYAPADGPEKGLIAKPRKDQNVVPDRYLMNQQPRAAFAGYPISPSHPIYGLWALKMDNGQWRIVNGNGGEDQTLETDGKVIGVIRRSGQDPALVSIKSNHRTIAYRNAKGAHGIPRASSNIVHACVNPWGQSIAYCTEEGEVAVYSYHYNRHLLRMEMDKEA